MSTQADCAFPSTAQAQPLTSDGFASLTQVSHRQHSPLCSPATASSSRTAAPFRVSGVDTALASSTSQNESDKGEHHSTMNSKPSAVMSFAPPLEVCQSRSGLVEADAAEGKHTASDRTMNAAENESACAALWHSNASLHGAATTTTTTTTAAAGVHRSPLDGQFLSRPLLSVCATSDVASSRDSTSRLAEVSHSTLGFVEGDCLVELSATSSAVSHGTPFYNPPRMPPRSEMDEDDEDLTSPDHTHCGEGASLWASTSTLAFSRDRFAGLSGHARDACVARMMIPAQPFPSPDPATLRHARGQRQGPTPPTSPPPPHHSHEASCHRHFSARPSSVEEEPGDMADLDPDDGASGKTEVETPQQLSSPCSITPRSVEAHPPHSHHQPGWVPWRRSHSTMPLPLSPRVLERGATRLSQRRSRASSLVIHSTTSKVSCGSSPSSWQTADPPCSVSASLLTQQDESTDGEGSAGMSATATTTRTTIITAVMAQANSPGHTFAVVSACPSLSSEANSSQQIAITDSIAGSTSTQHHYSEAGFPSSAFSRGGGGGGGGVSGWAFGDSVPTTRSLRLSSEVDDLDNTVNDDEDDAQEKDQLHVVRLDLIDDEQEDIHLAAVMPAAAVAAATSASTAEAADEDYDCLAPLTRDPVSTPMESLANSQNGLDRSGASHSHPMLSASQALEEAVLSGDAVAEQNGTCGGEMSARDGIPLHRPRPRKTRPGTCQPGLALGVNGCGVDDGSTSEIRRRQQNRKSLSNTATTVTDVMAMTTASTADAEGTGSEFTSLAVSLLSSAASATPAAALVLSSPSPATACPPLGGMPTGGDVAAPGLGVASTTPAQTVKTTRRTFPSQSQQRRVFSIGSSPRASSHFDVPSRSSLALARGAGVVSVSRTLLSPTAPPLPANDEDEEEGGGGKSCSLSPSLHTAPASHADNHHHSSGTVEYTADLARDEENKRQGGDEDEDEERESRMLNQDGPLPTHVTTPAHFTRYARHPRSLSSSFMAGAASGVHFGSSASLTPVSSSFAVDELMSPSAVVSAGHTPTPPFGHYDTTSCYAGSPVSRSSRRAGGQSQTSSAHAQSLSTSVSHFGSPTAFSCSTAATTLRDGDDSLSATVCSMSPSTFARGARSTVLSAQTADFPLTPPPPPPSPYPFDTVPGTTTENTPYLCRGFANGVETTDGVAQEGVDSEGRRGDAAPLSDSPETSAATYLLFHGDDDPQHSEFQLRIAPEKVRAVPRGKMPRGLGFSMRDWSDAISQRQKQVGASNLRTYMASLPRLRIADVMRHKHADDLWIVIRHVVYDCTQFARFHPGGDRLLVECGGKDATQVYDTFHPWIHCESMMGAFAVGVIADEDRPSVASLHPTA